jgi:16S rRNA (uracil1498-N3)-methyltransferase
MQRGDALELFDDHGAVADAVIDRIAANEVLVHVGTVRATGSGTADEPARTLTIAAAVPRGPRADWMVEKLSELGVSGFVPLVTARSVVLPTGQGKTLRWQRIAAEAARQSRRAGVMRIQRLTELPEAVNAATASPGHSAWFLSTAPSVTPLARLVNESMNWSALTLFVGPEGGWTQAELRAFADAGLTGVALTRTILRVETAAVAAAVIVACCCGAQRALTVVRSKGT